MGFLSKLFGKTEAETTKQEIKYTKAKTNNITEGDNIPPLQGAYAKTIFLWANEKASPVKKSSEYARYFLYECGIRDCVSYHLDLISDGYFEEASTK